MNLFGSIAAVTAIAVTGTLAAVAAPNPAKHGHGLKAEPGIFDPDNTGLVVGQWGNGGIDSGPGVLLAKIEPTSTNAAAQVEFKGVSGKTLTTIGFTIRTDTDCGGGAPRFNVVTEEDPGTTHFFGCNSTGATAMANVGDPFTDSAGHQWQVKEATLEEAGIQGDSIDSLEIVHDEEGASIIDDIVVNDTTISKPSKKK